MRRIPRIIARGAWTGGALFFLFALLEAVVLLAKRPEPWSIGLAARLFWSPAIYGVAGIGLGILAGFVAALFLGYRRRRVTSDSERSSVWALLLPAVLGFFWIYAANRLYPGHSRDTTALALDAVALAAALVLVLILWRRTVSRRASFRARAVWTVVLALVLWLPLYALSGAPSLEHTRISRPPEGTPRAPENSVSLLLIMIDTVRTDCLSCYGPTEFPTPALDAFASEGVLFEQAVTPEPLTRPAVCTMFTGFHPRSHGVDSNTKALGSEFVTLAECMREAGYGTAAFTAATVLSGNYGTAQGFDHYSEPSEPWWYLRSDSALRRLYLSLTSWASWWMEIPAVEVNRRAIDWLDRNGDRPFFAFVHYFDPHAPYEPPPEHDLASRAGLGRVPPPYDDEQIRFSPDFRMPADFLRRQWLRYRGEISYADESLGELLDYLELAGLSDRTVVAVVGDHGESFEHQAWFSHGTRLYDPQLHVPLILRGPGVPASARMTDQVRLIDLYPTLLSLVGRDAPAPVQGVDLLPRIAALRPEDGGTAGAAAGAGSGHLPAFCQTDLEDRRPLSSRVSYALRLPPWKYIVSPEMELIELYNLEDDPAETTDLAASEPAALARLAAALHEWQTSTVRLELAPEEMTPEALESLRALGYLQ